MLFKTYSKVNQMGINRVFSIKQYLKNKEADKDLVLEAIEKENFISINL